MDAQGDPYNYIIVIDAGSKSTRAHVYRSQKYVKGKAQNLDPRDADESGSDDDRGGDSDGTKWIDEPKPKTAVNFPAVKRVYKKKVKPGVASFVNEPKKLGRKYFGKLLSDVEKRIPNDQRHRTPIFLHATGGMRLLQPEKQTRILSEICSYISKEFDFYLPDCASHINIISGEIEGLYSWIGLNYQYGVFDNTLADNSTYGALDMGGVSSQIAFEPLNVDSNDDYFFTLQMNYWEPVNTAQFHYKVFSESFLGGVNQAHAKYDELLISQEQLVDPCLPEGYKKTVIGSDGSKVDLKGSSDFKNCLVSLYTVLDNISVDKYCNQTDATNAASCLLFDNFPQMDFNVKKLIGINEFYSNLKEYSSYKHSYEAVGKICGLSYDDLLKETDDDDDVDARADTCFKASWVINVLHQGVGFPRYGIDEVQSDRTDTAQPDNFGLLDGFSWTLGRAVLYAFDEAAEKVNNQSSIGYYEPSSRVFVHGAEYEGVAARPDYHSIADEHHSDGGENNDDDDDADDDADDWEFEDHRLWGSLVFLFILAIGGWLLMGHAKRQSIKDAFKRVFSRVNLPVYRRVDLDTVDDLELQEQPSRKDSFEVE